MAGRLTLSLLPFALLLWAPRGWSQSSEIPPCTTAPSAPRVTSIQFEGLNRTDSDFLRPFLQSQVGFPYDSARTATNANALSSMEPFRTARATTHRIAPDSCVLRFSVEEYEARLPYVNFGGLTDNFWFQIGGIDTNWLGRGYHLGVYYRYDYRHSVGLHQSMPYLVGRHWGLSYSVDRLATTEPAFFGSTAVPYDVTRYSATALLTSASENTFSRHGSRIGGSTTTTMNESVWPT